MRTGKSILKILCAIALVVILTACSGIGGGPSRHLVKQAITLELSQTQQQLGQQLRIDSQPGSISISRVRITDQTPLEIGSLQSFRVQGTYDYTVKLPSRQVTQKQNPFEVYLQRQKEGKTWRLAKLKPSETGEPLWTTQRLTF